MSMKNTKGKSNKRHNPRLTRIVDDLLDVSRIAQGKIKLQIEPVDMAAVINHAVEMAEPICG